MQPTLEIYQLGFIVIIICCILTTLFAMTISSRVTEIWKTLLEWRESENKKDSHNTDENEDSSIEYAEDPSKTT